VTLARAVAGRQVTPGASAKSKLLVSRSAANAWGDDTNIATVANTAAQRVFFMVSPCYYSIGLWEDCFSSHT
jgi:hypothetical protein